MQRAFFAIGGAILLLVITQPGVLAKVPAKGHPPASVLEELVQPGNDLHDDGQLAGKGLLGLGIVMFLWAVVQKVKDDRPEPIRPAAAQGRDGRPAKPGAPAGKGPASRPPSVNPAAAAEKRLDYDTAASLFENQQDWKSAARCHGKAAQMAAAGSAPRSKHVEAWAKCAFAANEGPTAVAGLVELGELQAAAALQGKLGDLPGQAELLARAGDSAAAAAVYQQAGDLRSAARMLEQAGDIKGAMELLARKDPHAAAKMCEANGDFLHAAELYTDAGEPDMAAAMYSRAGDPEKATEIYRQWWGDDAAADHLASTGKLAEAAMLWIEIGKLDKAVQAYQKLGDPTGLARLLEERGELIRAARAYLDAGQPTEAIRVGELLTPEQRDSSPARLVLGAAHLELGKPDDAIDALRPLVSRAGGEVPKRCEGYYLLGLAYERGGDPQQAVTCFEQCLALDPSFRDAPLRLGQLRATNATHIAAASGPSGAAPKAAPGPGGLVLPERYMLLGQIGEGAMGTVYKAKDTVLDRPVALKVLSHSLSENETARTYFLREARAAAALNHAHIVTVFDAGFEGALLYLVMEYLEGDDLETLATRPPGGLPEKSALRYAAQVADALASVHAMNIIHRDVKPGNVMVVKGTEKVKLMDFGIAHLTMAGGQKSKGTMVAGTPDFMAPEQFTGKGLGPWTDIYALGGTLYELLTGQVPFPEVQTTEADGDPLIPDPRRLKPQTSAATAELVLACLAKDPKSRPQTANVLRDKLEQIAAGLPG